MAKQGKIWRLEHLFVSDLTVLILAAGSSSRLGQSKQLVKFEGQSLLQRTAAIALTCSEKVAVVLGSQFDRHQKDIAQLPVAIIQNTAWQKGMGSSLKVGMQKILSLWPATTEIIVLVCDQPRVTSELMQRLIDRSHHSIKQAICCSYQNTLGVPALFKKEMFPHLLQVSDSEGAKKLIQQNPDKVDSVQFEGGKLDIDTPEDLQQITLD